MQPLPQKFTLKVLEPKMFGLLHCLHTQTYERVPQIKASEESETLSILPGAGREPHHYKVTSQEIKCTMPAVSTYGGSKAFVEFDE